MPDQPTTPASAVEKALARAHAELPAMAPLLDAFGPILSERERIRQGAPGWQGQLPPFDAERYRQGESILSGQGFEDMSDHLLAAAATMLPVMEGCFPALAGEFQALAQAVASGSVTGQQLAMAAFGEPLEVEGASATTIAFASAELVRPFLERQAQDLVLLGQGQSWSQGACPVCGSAPNLSLLHHPTGTEGQGHAMRRFLLCSCCSTQWEHPAEVCPACGCDDGDELAVLHDPERPHERADLCKRCRSFVLCLDAAALAEMPDAGVAALAMLPLEVQARQEGYTPMGLHPWSGL